MLRKRRPRASAAKHAPAQPSGEPAADSLEADPLASVLSTATAWLSRRDHCTAELAERLQRRGFRAALVAQTLEQLREQGYLDDARYAREFVRVHIGRGQGPRRIRFELVGLGLAAGLAESALQTGSEESGGWSVVAQRVRLRRFGQAPPADAQERARQARFLQSRGFSHDHIRTALGQYAPDDLDAEPPDDA